jgi:hypothetical protein
MLTPKISEYVRMYSSTKMFQVPLFTTNSMDKNPFQTDLLWGANSYNALS